MTDIPEHHDAKLIFVNAGTGVEVAIARDPKNSNRTAFVVVGPSIETVQSVIEAAAEAFGGRADFTIPKRNPKASCAAEAFSAFGYVNSATTSLSFMPGFIQKELEGLS